ncbi:hypothetical protein SANTM175S_07888 [Streptomyces antimycoticus]
MASCRYPGAAAAGTCPGRARRRRLRGRVPGTDGSGRRCRDRRGHRDTRSGQGRKDHADRVGPGDTRAGTNGEIQQLNWEFEKKHPNADQAGRPGSSTDLQHLPEAGRLRQQSTRCHPGNQGYPEHGGLRPGRAAHPVEQHGSTTGTPATPAPSEPTGSPPTATTGRAGSLGSPRPASTSASTTTRTCCGGPGSSPRAPAESPTAGPGPRGELPVQFGNLDKYLAIHTFGVLLHQLGAADARDTVLGRGDGFDNAATKGAAATLADDERGHPAGGAERPRLRCGQEVRLRRRRVSADRHLAAGRPQEVHGRQAGDHGDPVTGAGQGLAWSITSRSRRPEVAAAYHFLTDAHAADVMTRHGVLPAVLGRGRPVRRAALRAGS